MNMQEQSRGFFCRLPELYWNALRQTAAENDRTMVAELMRALRAHFEDEGRWQKDRRQNESDK